MAKIQSASTPGKETIYVDVDDEITAIIDKVQNAKGKVVALVLPKRCPVLQSIVNMKLLKRTAENAQKNLVLVTTESGLMPLAGSVGLHVADTPTSKPAIPPAPFTPSDEPENIDEPLDVVDGTSSSSGSKGDDFDPKTAAGKSVGELAAAGVVAETPDDAVDDSIDMAGDDEAPAAADTGAPGPKKNKKLKVPNFDSFRKRLLLGCLAVVIIIVAWVLAVKVLPRATVTIHTDSSTVASNLDLTLNTAAKQLDPNAGIVPATSESQQKTDTQTVPATGQQNNGQKASGSVTMTACIPPLSSMNSIPTGTSISQGGLTYITQETTGFSPVGPDPGDGCFEYKSQGSTDILALKGGQSYNVSSATFKVTGDPSVTAAGSASGGTDDIITVVAQADIDTATSKIKAADTGNMKKQLTSALQAKGLVPVPPTFLAGAPQVTTSAKVGDQAANVTVTAVTAYTMLGVHKSDLQKLVDANVEKHIDKSKQVILDDGVAGASFTQANPGTATTATVSMHAESLAGPQLNTAQLKQQLAGKKSGDIRKMIGQTPGVKGVDVQYSPFWVTSVPNSPNKLTIQIDKSGRQ